MVSDRTEQLRHNPLRSASVRGERKLLYHPASFAEQHLSTTLFDELYAVNMPQHLAI
jgi:hypothetical protein